MAKAILELPEMPENCKECLLHSWESNTLICKVLLVNGLPHKRRDDCPLKPVEKGGDEMLTEKQLQALIDCEEKEDCTGETCPIFEICDNDYTNKVAAEAAQTALAYREMLERLEWIEHKDWLVECCPFCKKGKNQGHAPDCELAKLLKGSEVEEG